MSSISSTILDVSKSDSTCNINPKSIYISEIDDNNDSENRKKARKQKKLYCVNCGLYGHGFKNCSNPITSFGIIDINLDGLTNKQIVSLKDNLKIDLHDLDGINIINHSDIEKFSKYQDKVKFLMIRRKHTLGFMEFIRGHYKIDNIEGIIYLFKQMVKSEIDTISTKNFDFIWNYAWGEYKINRESEYKSSKDKFEKLKEGFDEILDLDFYVDKVKPKYETPEWGFPKGRRNFQEDDLHCALREFEEESGISKQNIDLYSNSYTIEESFTGTNGVLYKHVYYISFSNNIKNIKIDPYNETQLEEIGDIGFFGFYDALEKIRPYHIERIKIVSNIYMAIMNILINK